MEDLSWGESRARTQPQAGRHKQFVRLISGKCYACPRVSPALTLVHCCVTTLSMEICLVFNSLRSMASPPAYSFLSLASKSALISNNPSLVLSSPTSSHLIPPHPSPLRSKESTGSLLIIQGHRGSRHHTLIWKMPKIHAHACTRTHTHTHALTSHW